MSKQVFLFRIYGKKKLEDGTVETFKTRICFRDMIQADDCVAYLNKNKLTKERNIEYFSVNENMELFKSSKEFIATISEVSSLGI